MTAPALADRPPLTAIPSRSLADEVAARVREAIVTGSLAPGQHLRETDLATMFEVSRSPVRDALVQLDHEGLVRLRRHRGAVVVGLSVEDVDELYTLRVSLELLAIRLVVARAGPDDVEELRRLADRVRDAAGTEPARTVAELDVRFHDQLYRLADHHRLYACWAMIQPQVYRFLLSRTIVNDDYRAIAADEHHELCDTIAAHDVAAATAMIERHLQEAYSRLRHEYARPSPVPPHRRPARGRSGPPAATAAGRPAASVSEGRTGP
ncbi:MAG TPA: GntR family transcriptional regulator [Candidatus Micrarchaeia archaeon]|nr:GntR family transcriptional regulator [Candidatus Micrarchaeia archaeon]